MKLIKNVVCGISGGVDSAVGALILKRKGYNVQGVFMRNWDLTEEKGVCSTQSDVEDAEFVCHKLKIPFHEVNFVKEYWTEVFSELVKGYEEGITPNPDVLCNKFVKFGHFFQYAINHLGADAVATGHYARNSWGQFLERSDPNTGAKLLKSIDQLKDQTLFLSQIPQLSLQKTMFPVGEMTKDVVKKIAVSTGFESIARKKESTGICFIGKRQFQDFIHEYVEPKPGDFVDLETGKIVGKHKGIHCWTIGQRTHLGGLSEAYFVADIQKNSSDILVVKGTNHPALFTQVICADNPHWINHAPEELCQTGFMHCHFRYQHTHTPVKCMVRLKNDELEVHISQPMRAISRGQYAVFYKDEECLGSAQISRTGPSLFEIDVRNPVENSKELS